MERNDQMAEKKSRDKHFHAASGQHLELKRVFQRSKQQLHNYFSV
jgi:hypothetical protein